MGAEDLWLDFKRKLPKVVREFGRNGGKGFAREIDELYSFREFGREEVGPGELFFQYNPDRFEAYRSVVGGADGEVLLLERSPHCALLRDYEELGTDVFKGIAKRGYYRMQRRYGKGRRTAREKVERLIGLYDDIKANGLKEGIVAVREPLRANVYNCGGLEIYEGHHRAACCYVLGMATVPVVIVEAVEKDEQSSGAAENTGN